MIKTYLSSVSKSKSLTAQIREAEQQILIRQRGVGVRAATLIKKIHQELTAPSTLLLTVGIGFIIGELTKRQTTNNRDTANKQRTTETSALRTALNLLSFGTHFIYSLAHSLDDQVLPSAGYVRSVKHANDKPNRCRQLPVWPVTAEGQDDNCWLIFWLSQSGAYAWI